MKSITCLQRGIHIWNPKIVILEKIKGFKGPTALDWPSNSNIIKDDIIQATPINKKLFNWFNIYENLIGLSEVKYAQQNVINAEREFLKALNVRKEKSRQIEEVQGEVREIRDQLETTARGQDKYLELVTLEHRALRKESHLSRDFKDAEEGERTAFQLLSSAVRESHEKERAQGEKTKYISLVGSLIGVLIGLIASGINNRIKMNQLKTLLLERPTSSETDPNSEVRKYVKDAKVSDSNVGLNVLLISQLTQALERDRSRLRSFLSDLKILLALDISEADAYFGDKSRERPTSVWRVLLDTLIGADNEIVGGQPGTRPPPGGEQQTENQPGSSSPPSPLTGIITSDDVTVGRLFTQKSALLLEELERGDQELEREMQGIKSALCARDDGRINLTFVDKEQLIDVLNANQKDLEWKLKMNSLTTTVVLYACIATTLPIIYSLTRGGGS